ncbi:defense protein l(2)34Fc-like [Homalodisca vitripennis]|uniref:defense protein l(2)34Fc-like n=1 Tax=Homalodisca vitripennis TaxID=197043 RepID=UPI001EEC3375|nr:defense protein l(2)34Fc-like [Homalodisca vitripennis]
MAEVRQVTLLSDGRLPRTWTPAPASPSTHSTARCPRPHPRPTPSPVARLGRSRTRTPSSSPSSPRDPRVDFRRFVVQALDRESGVAVGMFVDTGDADMTVVNCFGRSENTAIEFDTEPKTEARMRWMPDFDYAGNITFLATIVQSGEIFWLREKGDSISVYNPW